MSHQYAKLKQAVLALFWVCDRGRRYLHGTVNGYQRRPSWSSKPNITGQVLPKSVPWFSLMHVKHLYASHHIAREIRQMLAHPLDGYNQELKVRLCFFE